jgi:hypothetical protein
MARVRAPPALSRRIASMRSQRGRAFVPNAPHAGWSFDDLWAIALWGAIALLVATRRFRRELGTGEPAQRPRLRGARAEAAAGM